MRTSPQHTAPTHSAACSRRRFLHRAATTSLLLFTASRTLAQKRTQNPVGLAVSNRFPDTTSSVTVQQPDRIRILQITDLHFFHKRDELGTGPDLKTVADVKRLIDLHQPDLLAVTGDLWHDNPDGRGEQFLAYCLQQL